MDDFLDRLPPDVAEGLREVEAELQRRRQALSALTERVRGLPTVPRAEAWLNYIVHHRSGWGDEEALTYLAAVGVDLNEAVSALRDEWQLAARDAIQQCARGMGSTFNSDTGETRRVGGMPLHEAERIRQRPSWQLRDFWTGFDHQVLHIDAAMLRAAESCDVGGFDAWWLRLADEAVEEAITGAVEPIPASYWLFSMARSTYARRLMPKALERTLEKICTNTQKQEAGPWRVWWGGPTPDEKDRPLVDTHHGLAANLAFSSAVLETTPSSVARGAAAELVKGQHSDGWWSAWAHHKHASTDVTARALLAIAALRPMGYKRALSTGLDWLRKEQTDSGYWFDRAQPDAVFLTTLVLDSISACTISHEQKPSRPAEKESFDIALSFPGDIRARVEQLACNLQARLAKSSVFYDNFFKADLARPNLDTFLLDIYRNRSKLLVVFVGGAYAEREWCGIEWRAIRDLIKTKESNRVMLVRVDDDPLDGLLSIDGYIDFRTTSVDDLADLVLARLKALGAS